MVYLKTLTALPYYSYKKNPFKIILKIVEEIPTDNLSFCQQHQYLFAIAMKKYLRVIFFNYFNGLNRILNGKDIRVFHYDAIYQQCIERYRKYAKK